MYLMQDILDLNSLHEDADDRNVLHVKHACLINVLPIIVFHCINTDVLVHTENTDWFVWMCVGLDRKNIAGMSMKESNLEN